MPDHVYRIIEVAGSSENSIEDAIKNAVSPGFPYLASGRLVRSFADPRPR